MKLPLISIGPFVKHSIEGLENIYDSVNYLSSVPLIPNHFYLPCFGDFRGIISSSSSILSYQGRDFNRSLIHLQFSETLTPNGLDWLKIHGANCYGLDKLSREDKISEVDNNLHLIKSVNLDFIRSSEFTGQFYAFISDINAALDSPTTPNHSIVFLDATCSGVQHLAALLGNSTLGPLVNVSPSDKVQDFYLCTSVYLVSLLSPLRVYIFLLYVFVLV